MAFADFIITWEDIKNTAVDISEELEDFTTAQQNLIIDAATRWVPQSRFLTDTFDARRNYGAHLAVMYSGPPAGEGTQSSVSIDSFSTGVTLAVNNPPAKQRILSTVYGEVYFHYENKHFTALFVG